MLAENLADTCQPTQHLPKEQFSIQYKEVDERGSKEGRHYIGKHKFVLLSLLSDESVMLKIDTFSY